MPAIEDDSDEPRRGPVRPKAPTTPSVVDSERREYPLIPLDSINDWRPDNDHIERLIGPLPGVQR
jgi:hypothetical protein